LFTAQCRISRTIFPRQKTQLDSFSRFDRTPTSDRHRATASTALAQRHAGKMSVLRDNENYPPVVYDILRLFS